MKRQYFTPRQLADAQWFPFFSVQSVYRLIDDGTLGALDVGKGGKRYLIPVKSVVKFLTLAMTDDLKKQLGTTEEEIINFLSRE